MSKKRPQYVTEYIKEVNNALDAWGVKESDNSLFNFACDYLLKRKMYQGFNFFKHKNVNGEDRLVLAGTADKTQYDCLQIY